MKRLGLVSQPKTFQAKTSDGLYLPLSRFLTVSRRTPTSFAKSSC